MIQFNNKKINEIYLGNKKVTQVYLGDKLIWPEEEVIPPIITLDQSISDPTKMYTGSLGKDGTPETNVVSWIRANSHRYVGNYDSSKGMVLKQLDDNDSTKYVDGTDASEDIKGTNGGDVFMKMPTFWFRGKTLDSSNNKYNIYITKEEPTDGKNWTKWDGNTLIGVYKAVAENTSNNTTGGLFSRSGATPTVGVSQYNFGNKARNRSNGDDHFMLVTYEAHQVMALLYMCYYGNMHAQNVIGPGASGYPKVTGQTNVDGMNDTVAEYRRSINFWGLENWWGDIDERIDNLSVANSSGLVNILNYAKQIVRQVQCPASEGEIKKMQLGVTLDVLPKEYISNSSYNTYYCDSGMISTYYSDRIACRSGSGSANYGGPFYIEFYSSNSVSSTSTNIGSRLQYQGRVVIE